MEGTRLRCQTCHKQFTRPPGTSRLNCYGCRPSRTRSPQLSAVPAQAECGELEKAALEELVARGRESSPAGKLWAHLMRRLDQGGHTGSQEAALAARAMEAQQRALAGAPKPADAADELQQRRRQRLRRV